MSLRVQNRVGSKWSLIMSFFLKEKLWHAIGQVLIGLTMYVGVLNKVSVRLIVKQNGDLWRALSKIVKIKLQTNHIEVDLTRNKNNFDLIQDLDKKFTFIKDLRKWIKKEHIKIIGQRDSAHVISTEKEEIEIILEIEVDQGVLLLIMIFREEDTVIYPGYQSMKKYNKQTWNFKCILKKETTLLIAKTIYHLRGKHYRVLIQVWRKTECHKKKNQAQPSKIVNHR